MIVPFSFLFLGFFLGMRHATDADHVVAVTTIVSRERSITHAAWIGAFWGIGHTLTLLLAGGAIIVFGLVVPERLGMSLEFSVALMLILLGLLNFRNFMRSLRSTAAATLHDHSHAKEFETEEHALERRSSWFDRKFGRLGFYQTLQPMVVGVVHGLAGSAAVALLVLPLIHNPVWAFGYLLIFGGGTIGGMMLITAAMALPISFTARRSAAFHRGIGFAAGFLSVAFGLFLVYQIGFVDGLFTK
ncbi:MAG TPA: high-affinity nickel-transport family protein [Verrucomicrobiae bacterium]|nr:high-affinity nickel-transport family protein [Verrucomicrobiae bacterium]